MVDLRHVSVFRHHPSSKEYLLSMRRWISVTTSANIATDSTSSGGSASTNTMSCMRAARYVFRTLKIVFLTSAVVNYLTQPSSVTLPIQHRIEVFEKTVALLRGMKICVQSAKVIKTGAREITGPLPYFRFLRHESFVCFRSWLVHSSVSLQL